MNENMKAFLDAIENNEELKEKVAEIDKKAQEEPEKYIDEYIGAAKEYGITLTREDFVPEQPGASGMNEEELQAVAGGEIACVLEGESQYFSDSSKGNCFCLIIGAVKGCGCVIAGNA